MGSFISVIENRVTQEEKFIENLIRSEKICVFSKSTCVYCDRTKELLNGSNLAYRVIELDKNEYCPNNNCSSVIRNLVRMTGHKTVPVIFIDGKFIGGYTDLLSSTRIK